MNPHDREHPEQAHAAWARTLLLLWGLFIVYGTTIPFDFSAGSSEATRKLAAAIETPWRSFSRMDVLSNILLFLPWGFLCALWQAFRGQAFLRSLIVASVSGLILSGCVELVQVYTPTRTTSLLDLGTNFGGSIIGAVLGWHFARTVWPLARPRLERLRRDRPRLALALPVAAGMVFLGLAPFDVSIDLGALKSTIKTARPIPFGPALDGTPCPHLPWSWTGEILTWTLVGGQFLMTLREARRQGFRAIVQVILLCGGLSLAIEVLQLTIHGRVADATSVLWAIVGSALGAAAVDIRRRSDDRDWLTPALVIWLGILVLKSWTPPLFTWPTTDRVGLDQLIPFWSYYRHTDIHALADILTQTVVFVPFGALFAARYPRTSPWFCGLMALVVGLVLETGQLFLPDRTAEITDALSAACGGAMGVGFWNWFRLKPDPASSQGIARYRVR